MAKTIYIANAYSSHGPATSEVLFDSTQAFKSGHYPKRQDIVRHPETVARIEWRDAFGEACVLPGKTAVARDIL